MQDLLRTQATWKLYLWTIFFNSNIAYVRGLRTTQLLSVISLDKPLLADTQTATNIRIEFSSILDQEYGNQYPIYKLLWYVWNWSFRPDSYADDWRWPRIRHYPIIQPRRVCDYEHGAWSWTIDAEEYSKLTSALLILLNSRWATHEW